MIQGSIPAHIKRESAPGTLTYLVADLSADYPIVNDSTVFAVNFKVKPNVPLGSKLFTLKGTNADLYINMLDSSFKMYNVPSATLEIDIANSARIDAFVNLYLGDEGSSLHNLLIGKVNPTDIDKAFENLEITVKSSPNDAGITYKGRVYWVQDANGHIASVDTNHRVTGRLNITAITPVNNAIVEIGGFGYLKKRMSGLNLVAEQSNALNTTANTPITLIPGDIGRLGQQHGNLATGSDGILDNLDFSAWLKIFKDIQSSNST